MALFRGTWGYTALQSFAAGAALCSTSLGTTLALLTPELKRTRVGNVLMAAALLDDVVGLVIAGIIPELANTDRGGVSWQTIVRPILVSLAFGMGTPLFAWIMKKGLEKLLRIKLHLLAVRGRKHIRAILWDTRTQLFVTVTCLSAFVAGSKYAGTSELFGAYLAGVFLAYVFSSIKKDPEHVPITSKFLSSRSPSPSTLPSAIHAILSTISPQLRNLETEVSNPTLLAFSRHLEPILTPLLGPIFFASIGAALPIGSLFTTHSTERGVSHRVVWRGIVYSILMILGKLVVGVWIVVWPEPKAKHTANGALSVDADVGRRAKRNGKLKVENTNDSGESRNDGIDKEGDVLRISETGNGASSTLITNHRPVVAQAISDHTSDGQRISSAVSPTTQFLNPACPAMLSNTEIIDLTLESALSSEPMRLRSSLLLGLAMVGRGEIALIVAQLGRPLLVGSGDSSKSNDNVDEEPYAIVIWAVLLSTFLGALGVGIVLGVWERKDKRKELESRKKALGDVG